MLSSNATILGNKKATSKYDSGIKQQISAKFKWAISTTKTSHDF